ncbi:MAG: gamma-butyrobetaine hydroxylase-like domain-containing protein [Bryobacteraceae bacterium]
MSNASEIDRDLRDFEPERVSVSKSKGIRIDWRDGHSSQYGLQYLRDHCPCATCTNAHGATPAKSAPPPSPFQMYKPALKLNGIEPAGNYAIRLLWNDGHSTGIYSYEHFRRICSCPECASRAQ